MDCSEALRIERGVEGIQLPQDEPSCTGCGARLREGQPATGAVERRGTTHHVRRLWCPACAPTPSENDAEWLVEADIALIGDASRQLHYPVLIHTTVVEELVRA